MRQCLGAAAAMHLGGNLIITVVLLSIAYSNYPGGEAIYRIHKIIPPDNNVVLYIDNVAIQSGVNRFTQINNNWKYYIADSTEWENTDLNKFTHLMIEAKSKYSKNLRPFFKSHDVMEFVEGFSHLHVNYQHYPPFKIKRKPILTILRRRDSPSSSGKQPTNIEETVEQQPEEGMREIEDEEERHDIQLETYPPDITPLDSTKTSEKNTDFIPSKNVLRDSNNLNFNRSKEENATSNEFETKSLELQVNSMKYKQISRTTEPHRAANLTELAHDERMTADSTKSENDFLREPEMTFPLPTGSAQTTNSRIKKSAMKTIRSKTNNLAFDALQDALREEENRPQSEGTPGNQLVMLMPLVSGRRKFIMPNIDISETNDSEDFPKENTQEMREKFSSGLKPSETQLDGGTTESSMYPSGSTKGKSMNDPNYNNGINAYPSSSVNDMVQYNPKSIQLTVQERGETAVNTVVPNLGPSQTTVATIIPNGRSMQQEQASYQVDDEHAIELYRVNHPEIQKESTLSPDRPTLKQNMDIGNRPVNRQSFVFLWFPEEAKLFKEYNRIEEMGSPPQVANSRNTNVLSNQVPQSTTTKEPPIVLNERQKHNSGRNINNIVRTSNKVPEVVIQPGKEQMNEKLESEQRKRIRM